MPCLSGSGLKARIWPGLPYMCHTCSTAFGWRVQHPGGNQGANIKSITHRCYLREAAFEWELTKETMYLPVGCLRVVKSGGYGRQVEELLPPPAAPAHGVVSSSSSLLLLSLELIDTTIYEP